MGCLVFFGGWVLDLAALKNVFPQTAPMEASTAAALVSAGVALLLLRHPGASPWRRRAGAGCAVLPLATGLAFLGELGFGWHLGIGEFPFGDTTPREQDVPNPARFAPTTAVSLVLVGLTLLTLDARPRRGWRPAEVLAVPVALVATMSLIGYTYAIPAFYGPESAVKMALNSAFCFLVVAVAVVLSRPHGRLLAVATTTAPGGMMARRFFPVVLLLPLMLGWLRLEASDAGLFDDRVGTWWLTAATIAAMGLLLWRGAIELNTADVDRRDLEDRLSELANYDQMTGLFTRHRFHEEVARHSALARRQGGSVTLIVLDLDRLKQVNDKLGHAAGDALIRGVAAAIASRVRATDLAGRLGGDEFGVLLVETTPEGALGVAQDLLVAIRAARPESTDVEAWSTASVGLALSSGAPSDDGGALLALADEAMYEAKRAGGDRTAHAWAGGVSGSPEVSVAAAVAPPRQAMGV